MARNACTCGTCPAWKLAARNLWKPSGRRSRRSCYRSRQREVPAGVTLVGPHRDEVRFLVNDVDAGIYGSRGQQRTAALALKLAEVDLMRRETGDQPLLLLDDVLSELDARRRRFLVEWLSSEDGPEQAVVTTTNLHALPEAFARNCQVWRVEMGQLSAIDGEAAAATSQYPCEIQPHLHFLGNKKDRPLRRLRAQRPVRHIAGIAGISPTCPSSYGPEVRP